MPTIQLYSQPMNPFTEKVACALVLKGLPFERVEITEPEEIARLNPATRELPVLEVDGERRADSAAIVAWLEELKPEPSLFASDPKIRGLQQNLAEWSDTSFAFYWNRWRAAREETERREASASGNLLTRLHSRVHRRGGTDGSIPPSDREIEIVGEIAKRLDDLVGFLGDRDFFYADRPSVADLAVYGMMLIMAHGPMPGSAQALEARPTLTAHLRRMSELAGRRPLSPIDGSGEEESGESGESGEGEPGESRPGA